MKSTLEIDKEQFIQKFAEPIVANIKKNISADIVDDCKTNVLVKGKTGKTIDFKSIVIEVDIPDHM